MTGAHAHRCTLRRREIVLRIKHGKGADHTYMLLHSRVYSISITCVLAEPPDLTSTRTHTEDGAVPHGVLLPAYWAS